MPSVRLGQSAWKLVQSPVVVFVVALVIRLWAAAQLLPEKMWPFFYQYNEPSRIAWAILSGHGYSSPWPNTPLAPTAQQPPVYPILLAGIFKLAGVYSLASLWIAVVLNACFSALTAVAILRLGKRDFLPLAGVLAAWVWSCWLYEAVVAIRIWESSLSALLLTVTVLLLGDLATSPRRIRWLIFGILAGLAVLTNTTLLAVFPFFWWWLWSTHRRRGASCGRLMLASIMVCIVVILPWTIRNYATFHRLIPVRDNFGLELWLGNHEGVTDRYDTDFPILNPSEYNRLGEITFMQTKRLIAMNFIRRHPGDFLRLSARRFFKFWTEPSRSLWLPMNLLAWTGLFLAVNEKRGDAIPYAIILLAFPVVYYASHTFPTYRHPIEPALLLLAAYALVGIVQAVSRRLGRTTSPISDGASAY